ncbi:tRNA preQ1(34) S-adenosylmethionine ribosyltransferase-isomerase QueA [Merismopedia glauca]|uniref:tRNA preQ1(34) S-adenosylmethionine ribosyltransferase-isomerase QueA n=1 Tax=Merismopedia glauca TaxID=292586 RepID=UPI001FE38E1C|nr:tRNA preQ1(34) S-adenosylmethionine ribosyltransferase-isomerase QueA [Merismopedia glauca]
MDYFLTSYDYELPAELIAQTPAVPRDSSRLLVVESLNEPQHSIFKDLPQWLKAGDLLVVNNTKVLPARIYGQKSTGGLVEILLLEEKQHNCWVVLAKRGRRLPIGTQIVFKPIQMGAIPLVDGVAIATLPAVVVGQDEATGGRLLQFTLPPGISLLSVLDGFGEMPLPPYITSKQSQPEQYQTIYAESLGAVAAPTAGLHFTPELLAKLQEHGVKIATVTLHVGVGTFRPVEVEDITTHKMHGEWIEVSAETVEQIQATKSSGGRVIGVGTTVARSLESAAQAGEIRAFAGKTQLFIYPGYQWRVVDGLITNFHLPRSSLMMMVSSLIGRERLLSLYREAIAHRYRFYSFGDAMLILPSG